MSIEPSLDPRTRVVLNLEVEPSFFKYPNPLTFPPPSDGVMQVFNMKRQEVVPAFKTLPGNAIHRLELGGPIGTPRSACIINTILLYTILILLNAEQKNCFRQLQLTDVNQILISTSFSGRKSSQPMEATSKASLRKAKCFLVFRPT